MIGAINEKLYRPPDALMLASYMVLKSLEDCGSWEVGERKMEEDRRRKEEGKEREGKGGRGEGGWKGGREGGEEGLVRENQAWERRRGS